MTPKYGQKTWPSNAHRVVPDTPVSPPRPNAMTFAARKRLITQHDLVEFERVKQELNDARRRYDAVRDELKAAKLGGATVEAGRLRLNVERMVDFRITAQSLKTLLGEDEVETLKARVPPTVHYRVTVSSAS